MAIVRRQLCRNPGVLHGGSMVFADTLKARATTLNLRDTQASSNADAFLAMAFSHSCCVSFSRRFRNERGALHEWSFVSRPRSIFLEQFARFSLAFLSLGQIDIRRTHRLHFKNASSQRDVPASAPKQREPNLSQRKRSLASRSAPCDDALCPLRLRSQARSSFFLQTTTHCVRWHR